MHLLVINCSPRTIAKSNTNLILQSFISGYTKEGNTVELYHLSQRSQWEQIRIAYDKNQQILMALPLFVECIPGLMMEFLESLPTKQGDPKRTQLSFLLQGGFSEASQFRCAERYLESLPSYLGCEYGGTLLKGNMFVTHMLPTQAQQQSCAPFAQMGETFAKDGRFDKEKVNSFAKPEYLSKRTILVSTLLRPLHKLFFHIYFTKLGCQGSLRAKPYSKS